MIWTKSQPGTPQRGHWNLRSLNLSQVSYNDSPCCWVKEVISALNWAVLPCRKYLLGKSLERPPQVMKEFDALFWSQSLVMSFGEKGNNLSYIASANTPFTLMVSHYIRKVQRCALRFLVGCPPNWSNSTNVTKAGQSLKLFGLTTGHPI